jgi:glycosyltransferase involved in cell wall biosynthesis
MLDELLAALEPQRCPEIEIIVDRQGGTIGEKRNRLLVSSQGEYVAYIDDDDSVSKNYVQLILKAIETKPDVCSLIGYYFEDKKYQGMFRHSIEYKDWKDDTKGKYKWHRCPNHLNAVKRSLAMLVMFPELNVGEDRDYSKRLLPLLKTEADIKEVLYLYAHFSKQDNTIVTK